MGRAFHVNARAVRRVEAEGPVPLGELCALSVHTLPYVVACPQTNDKSVEVRACNFSRS